MDQARLTDEEVRRIARLARLDVAEAELGDLAARLTAVLGYVARLDALDLTDVAEMPHVADESNVLGEDALGPMLDRQTLLDMAPEAYDRFLRVPKVLGDGGGA